MMTSAPRIAHGDTHVRILAGAIVVALVMIPAASIALRTKSVYGTFVANCASCARFLDAFSPALGVHKRPGMQPASSSSSTVSVT
jgi:hypothetical protein